MPRKSTPHRSIGPDWHLTDWMATLQVSQADLSRLTGWSKATMNDIFHGRTEYYRAVINQLASALKIQPFELLMHPEDAMALRRLRDSALSIAAEPRSVFAPAEPIPARLRPGRAN